MGRGTISRLLGLPATRKSSLDEPKQQQDVAPAQPSARSDYNVRSPPKESGPTGHPPVANCSTFVLISSPPCSRLVVSSPHRLRPTSTCPGGHPLVWMAEKRAKCGSYGPKTACKRLKK